MPPYENPNNHVPPHPSKPCTAMLLCSQLSPCLVCMLGCYTLPLLLLGLGYHLIIIIVVDHMIIIINVHYIRRRMEGRAIPSDDLFHSSHLGPEFRVLVS